ncbi:unnamed protein product [Linum trigynum]|uniref:Uncharacterized protein n=1 Tax=Linum trigynum TaxID=586398 RepID=A0AAV2E2K9_9ROSI
MTVHLLLLKIANFLMMKIVVTGRRRGNKDRGCEPIRSKLKRDRFRDLPGLLDSDSNEIKTPGVPVYLHKCTTKVPNGHHQINAFESQGNSKNKNLNIIIILNQTILRPWEDLDSEIS